MFKVTFKTTNSLSEISVKAVKIDFIRNPKIEECPDPNEKIKNYVYTHFPNAIKFEVGSDYLAVHNRNHRDLDITIISLDVVING